MKPPPDPHYRHRFSAEIISYAVWLYHVFSLSLRDVELLLAERGISSPTRRCDVGARNSVRVSPTACAVTGRGQGISGTWTKSSSGSRACSITSGALSIRMALCSTSSFRPGAMPTPPSASSGGF